MTILIIESIKEDQQIFSRILNLGGYNHLIFSSSVDEVFASLGLNGSSGAIPAAFGIDLIIIGARSPEDCLDTCRILKESFYYQDTPVLVAAEGALSEGITMSVAYGALDYMRKPFNDHEFLSKVRSAIRLKHEIDRRKSRERELLEATRQLYDLNSMLTKLSLIDGLTGIANRRNFDRLLENEWRRAARSGHMVALIMLDIDYFKSFNDHYGHQGGDECLKQVAQILKNSVHRPGDMICRYGGEEFAIILPDTDEEGAIRVGENVRANVEKASITHLHSKVARVVTLSLGVAVIKPLQEQQDVREIITAADQALYLAKNSGRNCYRVAKEQKDSVA